MATSVQETEQVQHDPAAHDAAHVHPGGAEYVRIAIILAVITAVEVALYYMPLEHYITVPILFVLSIGKFALVALYFMHLKFDNRMFTTFFAGGLVMVLAAFVAVLAMFRVLF
jgi:cytochrome c oxidase subunit 4